MCSWDSKLHDGLSYGFVGTGRCDGLAYACGREQCSLWWNCWSSSWVAETPSHIWVAVLHAVWFLFFEGWGRWVVFGKPEGLSNCAIVLIFFIVLRGKGRGTRLRNCEVKRFLLFSDYMRKVSWIFFFRFFLLHHHGLMCALFFFSSCLFLRPGTCGSV